MDNALICYDMSRYNFTKETWNLIFAYESKLEGEKLFRKVNFKKGEKESYISWIDEIIKSPEYEFIVLKGVLLYKSIGYYSKDEESQNRKLNNPIYVRNKLERILKRNKYTLPKVSKYGLRFSFSDVREFLAILKEAKYYNCLDEFIEIPDVWYIIKNIRENWGVITNKVNGLEDIDYNVYF